MAKISIGREEFLDTVRKSGVVDSEYLDKLSRGNGDAAAMARKLLASGRLTEWQTRYLLTGRPRLKLGKYILLDSLARDSLGDRFLAQHTTLNRKVQLQILPAELAERPDRFQLFLDQAQLAATLNHPHLMHVYDIDKESGRYYLVLENVEGTLARDVELDKISDLDVGILIDQALDGIRAAHEKGVVHGSIDLATLVLRDPNDLVITDIATSTLRRQLDPNESQVDLPDQVEDVVAIGRAGVELIKRCDRSSSAGSLLKMFGELVDLDRSPGSPASKIPVVHGRIRSWIEDNPAANSLLADEMAREVTTDQFPAAVVQTGVGDGDSMAGSEPQTPPTRPSTHKQSLAGGGKPGGSRRTAKDKSARKPPRLLIGSVALSLIALAIVAGYLLFSRDDGTQEEQVVQNSQFRQHIPPTDAQPLVTGINEANDKSDPDDQQTANHPAAGNGNSDSSNQSDAAETASNLAADTGNGQAESAAEPPPDQQPDDSAGESSAFDVDEFLDNPGRKEPPPEESDGQTGAPGAASEANTKAGAVGDRTEPVEPNLPVFASFGNAMALPEIPDAPNDDSLVIAQLFPPAGKLETISLLPNDNKSGRSFRTRQIGSAQQWIIELEQGDQRGDIAELSFSETVLSFRWLPDALANRESAGFLANCFLSITAAGKTKAGGLRTPVKVEPLRLDPRRLTGQVNVDIPQLPPVEDLRFEVLPVTAPDGTPISFANEKSSIDGDPEGESLRMDLSEDVARRYFWLKLTPQYSRRGRVKLNAAVFVQPFVEDRVADGVKLLVPTLDSEAAVEFHARNFDDALRNLKTYQDRLKFVHAERQRRYDTREVEENRRDYKDLNDKMLNVIEELDEAIVELELQKETMEGFSEVPIPFRIIYRLDEKHELVAARPATDNANPSPPVVDLGLPTDPEDLKNVLQNSQLAGDKGEIAHWQFEFTAGGDTRNQQYILDRSTNQIALQTYNGRGSVTQSGIGQSNLGASRVRTAQVQFDVGWSDANSRSDKGDASRLTLHVSGVPVWTTTTADGDSGDSILSNAESNAAISSESSALPSDALTTILVDLPPSIETIDEVGFSWSLGHDDFVIDNIELLTEPDRGGILLAQPGEPTPIVGRACYLSDPDSPTLKWLTVSLTNPQAGDLFSIDGKQCIDGKEGSLAATELAYRVYRKNGNLIFELSGNCPVVQYAYALRSLRLVTSNEEVTGSGQANQLDQSDRVIDIVAFDGAVESEPVTGYIVWE